jgi:hypothetical protein
MGGVVRKEVEDQAREEYKRWGTNETHRFDGRGQHRKARNRDWATSEPDNSEILLCRNT